MRSGSVCSGAGMLDRAVEELFGASTVWQAETDPAASEVLAHHWPGVPNLGDIASPPGGPYGLPRRHLTAPRRQRQAAKRHARRVKGWKDMASPVDIIGGGFPCQGFSLAGKRAGSADERHLWPTGVLPAIEALLPPVVVLENVPGLLTIERGSVFGRILADLDGLGYALSWTTVGACKVGACHHRHRLFALAVRSADVPVPSGEPFASRRGAVWLPVQDVLFGDAGAVKWPPSGVSRDGLVWPLPVDTCGADGIVLPTPTASRYGSNQSDSPGAAVRPSLDAIAQLLPTPTARIADKRGTPSVETAADRMAQGRRNLEDAVALLPTPRVSAVRTGRSAILGSSSSPSLEQAMEIARGELPRELESWEEAPPAWQPLPTPTARDATRGAGWGDQPGRPLSEVAALLPTPRASDTGSAGRRAGEGWRPPLSEVLLGSDARGVGSLLPTPRASDASKGGPNQRGSSGDLMLPSAVQPGRFGVYEAAVRRQETAFGMVTPDPTEPGRLGKPRLAAPFCEWMMGLPRGWITEAVGRGDAIRIAGNGVVGQAVVYALPTLPTFPAAVAAMTGQAVAT